MLLTPLISPSIVQHVHQDHTNYVGEKEQNDIQVIFPADSYLVAEVFIELKIF